MALALGILILYIAESAIKFSRMDFLDYKDKNEAVSSLLYYLTLPLHGVKSRVYNDNNLGLSAV